jgi:hypothetical protein
MRAADVSGEADSESARKGALIHGILPKAGRESGSFALGARNWLKAAAFFGNAV